MIGNRICAFTLSAAFASICAAPFASAGLAFDYAALMLVARLQIVGRPLMSRNSLAVVNESRASRVKACAAAY